MSLRILLLAGAAFTLAVAAANAKDKGKDKETRVERSHTCVCTMSGPGEGSVTVAPLPSMPAVPAVPAVRPDAMWHMAPPMHHGGPHVFTFRDGDEGEDRVIVIRKGSRFRDSADADGDGEVTRREFMRRAEKHFKERDKNDDGKLDENEMGPMPFTMPLPPPPPAAPAPPAPPQD